MMRRNYDEEEDDFLPICVIEGESDKKKVGSREGFCFVLTNGETID